MKDGRKEGRIGKEEGRACTLKGKDYRKRPEREVLVIRGRRNKGRGTREEERGREKQEMEGRKERREGRRKTNEQQSSSKHSRIFTELEEAKIQETTF